jgi:homocysteine S-methyltransferase
MTHAKYRSNLPQMSGRKMLTDGGLETCLVFHEGMDLPCFAAFDLLRTRSGRQAITDYLKPYLELAVRSQAGFVLETPTWRANRDWGERLGYSAEALAQVNVDAVDQISELRDRYETAASPMVLSGNIGPRGDGYIAGARMTAAEAEAYHGVQVRTFAATEADMVAAFTLNYAEEAIGVARAAAAAGMPAAISFTLETDGRLPSGQPLGEAIEMVDHETGRAPAYYMINCAHPSHFEAVLQGGDAWTDRVLGLRANASRCSHAELDEAEVLDEGNPEELGSEYAELRGYLPKLAVFGGCCGTDYRHVEAIARNVIA